MSFICAVALILVAVGLMIMMIFQALSGKVQLLTMRNLYLLGFIVYQLSSSAQLLISEESVLFVIEDYDYVGLMNVAYTAVFLPAFLWAYQHPGPWRKIANTVRGKPASGGDLTLIIVAIGLIGFAFLRLLIPFIPYVSTIIFYFASGFATASCVFVGWVCARRYTNLVVLAAALGVFVFAALISLEGSYSRRPLLSVCTGFSIGFVYGLGNRLKPRTLVSWSAALGAGALVVVSSYTAVRHTDSTKTIYQTAADMLASKERLTAAIGDSLGGQRSGEGTAWCMENHPSPFDYRHLYSFRVMLVQVVPRMFWEDKPVPLSKSIGKMGKARGVNHDRITLTPSIFGYAAAEGGFYALIIYAIFYGGFCRTFDIMLAETHGDPFMLAAAASVTGHIIGLPRGDLSTLTVTAFATFVCTWSAIWILRNLVGKPIEQRMICWQWIPNPRASQPERDPPAMGAGS